MPAVYGIGEVSLTSQYSHRALDSDLARSPTPLAHGWRGELLRAFGKQYGRPLVGSALTFDI